MKEWLVVQTSTEKLSQVMADLEGKGWVPWEAYWQEAKDVFVVVAFKWAEGTRGD